MPTTILPWHPGMNRALGSASRATLADAQFEALLADIAAAAPLLPIAGIISGYLGHAAQAQPIAALVRAVKAAHPNALYVCDPVTGDAGGLYVPEATALAVRACLLPLADIVTPNRFELGWLTGRNVETVDAAVDAARHLAVARVLVTSAPLAEGRTGNLLVGQHNFLCHHPAFAPVPNGTGDMLAAAFLARCLRLHHTDPAENDAMTDRTALADATSAVARAADYAAQRGDSVLLLSSRHIPAEHPLPDITLEPVMPQDAIMGRAS
ncbi:MAG: pyridoxal kinase [Phyllobacteriaceae bacterium]|nr:pyridoxal kinase [Phyllobacteriaceae bacterium]